MGSDGVVEHKYGQQAKELRLSSFFRRPEVWRAVGTDQEFLDWLRCQDCAFKTSKCAGDIVPMHVRRVSNGSGVGFKPEYSAIPGCFKCHASQHQLGETSIAPREEWDKKRIEYLVKWCWNKLKADLGYDSWSDVPPVVLHRWAFDYYVKTIDSIDLIGFLPESYQRDNFE